MSRRRREAPRPSAAAVSLLPLAAGGSREMDPELPPLEGPYDKSDFPSWQRDFLTALLDHEGNVRKAAEAVKVSMPRLYQVRDKHAAFAEAWDHLMDMVRRIRADEIEHATSERAVKGSPYRKFRDGEVVEEGSTPDTAAAALMLKGYRPERFQEKTKGTADVIDSVAALVRAVERARPVELPSAEAIPVEIVRDADLGPLVQRGPA